MSILLSVICTNPVHSDFGDTFGDEQSLLWFCARAGTYNKTNPSCYNVLFS